MMEKKEIVSAKGTKLDIEPGSRLLISTAELKEKMQSELIGLSPFEFLLIRMPLISGMYEKFHEGKNLVVRYISKGTIFAFNGSVITSVRKPTPLLFIDYPKRVEMIELRQEERNGCHIQGNCHCRIGVVETVIVDISLGGCKTAVKKNLKGIHDVKAEDLVVMNFFLNGDEEETTVSGIIKNITIEGDAMYWGVKFSEVGAEAEERINAYIDMVKVFSNPAA
jgi:c-di-GMP-binding flagellar brake protein YcgR